MAVQEERIDWCQRILDSKLRLMAALHEATECGVKVIENDDLRDNEICIVMSPGIAAELRRRYPAETDS